MPQTPLPTKIQKMPSNRRVNLERETSLAIRTIQYADSVYWSSAAGHSAIRELLQVNFLDSLVYVHNVIAEMTGEHPLSTPPKATFNANWRRDNLSKLIHDIEEARYLGATDFVMDTRDEYRIPAVQGLFRATHILRGIIEDFTDTK